MSNFTNAEVVPINYGSYSIFSLLCSHWDICEEISAINALISIDNLRIYVSQRRNCYNGLRCIREKLEQKWLDCLPPLFVLLLKHSNNKFIYNPKRFEKRQYFRFLMVKKQKLINELRNINRYNERKRRRRGRTFIISRGCLR